MLAVQLQKTTNTNRRSFDSRTCIRIVANVESQHDCLPTAATGPQSELGAVQRERPSTHEWAPPEAVHGKTDSRGKTQRWVQHASEPAACKSSRAKPALQQLCRILSTHPDSAALMANVFSLALVQILCDACCRLQAPAPPSNMSAQLAVMRDQAARIGLG